MTYGIDVQNDEDYPISAEGLQHAAEIVLAQQAAAPGSSMTIVITTDEAVAALNREFRGLDMPTDVLSFPSDMPAFDDEPPYLGDLVIAYPYTASVAAREGHDLAETLLLLVIHGALHLLGYDHDTTERRAAMWKAQESALKVAGISPDIVPALEGETHDDGS